MAASATAPEAATIPARSLDICIAGIRLAFQAPQPYLLRAPAWEYPPFLSIPDTERRLPIEVRVLDADSMGRSLPGTRLFTTGEGWSLDRLDDGPWCISMREQSHPARVLWRALGEPPFERWVLECERPPGATNEIRHLAQYPLDQVLLTHSLYGAGGILVHAAGVAMGERAVVFPGVSGAGKSTLIRLLGGDDAIVGLSDDRMVLREQGREVLAHGTPWAGDARIASPQGKPLHSLCFIRQARDCAIRRLDPAQALHRLLPVTTLAWYDEVILGQGLDTCQRLLGSHPCYELDVPGSGQGLSALLRDHVHAG